MAKFQMVLKKSDTFKNDCTWNFESDLGNVENGGIVTITTNENYPLNELYLIDDTNKYLYSCNDINRSLMDLTESHPAKFYIPKIGWIEIYKITIPNHKITEDTIIDGYNKFIGKIKVDDPNSKIEISMKKLYELINFHLPSLFHNYKQIAIRFDGDKEEFILPLDKVCNDAILTKLPDYTNTDITEYKWNKSIEFNDVKFNLNCSIYNDSGIIINLCKNENFNSLSPYNKFKFLQKIMYEIEADYPSSPLKGISTDCYINGIRMYFVLEKVNKLQRVMDALPIVSYHDIICYEKDNHTYRIPVKYEITFNNINIAYDIYTYGMKAIGDLFDNLPISVLELANQVSNTYKYFQGTDKSFQITVSASLLV